MKKPKIGRPPLNKEKAMPGFMGLRLQKDEVDEIAQKQKELNQPASEVVRRTGVTSPIWTTCKWEVDQLDEKWIRAHLHLNNGLFEITGKLRARKRPSGEKFLKIQLVQDMGYNSYRITEFPLTQADVDRIIEADKAKDGVDFKAPAPETP